MGSKAEKDRQKQIQDRCQNMLNQMLRDDDNKYCVDCDAKGPRWASWNLGIFLCIRCAGIHRNLGVHISKVKSVNLDTWTPEQVVSLEQMGNSRARAVYEANLPDNFRRPQTDSALESFIRAKYEHKKYIAREWCPPPQPKVNWDKEIEEEERLRKKKRESKTSSAPINSSVVKKLENVIPAPLPKPTSSPKTSRTSASTTSVTSSPAQSASADLLGLDTPSKEKAGEDDIFGSLVSAEPLNSTISLSQSTPNHTVPLSNNTTIQPVNTTVASAPGRSQEEENFFSQPSLSSAQDKKLTKDSILALYSSQPSFPSGGGGMFENNSMPQSYTPFGGMQNGLVMPTGNHMAQHSGLVQPNVIPQQPGLNRLPNSQQLPPQGNLFGNPMHMASNPFYRMSQQAPVPNQPTPNLVPQMSGLNLGQNESLFPAQNQPVTHNMWH